MISKLKRILIFFFILNLPTSSFANQVINLQCNFYESYSPSDKKTYPDKSTTDIQITLIPSSKTSYLAKRSTGMLFCSEFTGSYSEDVIFGSCVDGGGIMDGSEYKLNRYSGIFTYILKTNGTILSINKAQCQKLSKKF